MLDKRDKLDEILKSRYDNSHADAPAWDELFCEEELDAIKPQGGFIFRRALVISAIAALIAVGVILSINIIDTNNPTASTVKTIVALNDKIDDENNEVVEVENDERISHFTTVKLSDKKIERGVEIAEQYNPINDSIVPHQRVVSSPAKKQKSEVSADSKKNYQTWRDTEPSRLKRRGKLSLIAATSFMSSAGGGLPMSVIKMNDSSIAVNINSYRSSVNFDNDAYSHKFPVNVSLSVRYEIVNRLSINGGLNYSYMESTAKNTEKLITYSLKRKVNYLGVPIALNYDFLRTKRFLMYGLAGGMVEFNVGSVNEIQCYSNDKYISTQKDKIYTNKPLFSLQGGIGARYNIINGFGIFIEPAINYVFRNSSQPITYKTNTPLQFNFKVGFTLDL